MIPDLTDRTPDILIGLPFPISTNSIWFPTKSNLVKSNRYRRWIKEADGMYLMQKRSLKPVEGHFYGVVTVDEAKRSRGLDIDNSMKCIFDRLQSWELIENDKLQDCVIAHWGEAPSGCLVEIYASNQFDNAVDES